MINNLKRAVNWANWHLGGLRDPDAFFKVTGDPIGDHIVSFGFDEPSLN